MRYKINAPMVTSETIDGEVVVINLDNGNYYSIEGIGADVWTLAENGTSVDEIARVLAQRYTGSHIAEGVHAFLQQVLNEHLLVEAPERQPAADVDTLLAPVAGEKPFEAPVLNTYTDMQDLLLLDPIHEVDEQGWPLAKNEDAKKV